jgi:hypothetical protein
LALTFLGKCPFLATRALASPNVSYTFSLSFRRERKKCPTDAQVRRISWDFVGSASLGQIVASSTLFPSWPPNFTFQAGRRKAPFVLAGAIPMAREEPFPLPNKSAFSYVSQAWP